MDHASREEPTALSFKLADQQWSYGAAAIIVLSKTLKTHRANHTDRVEMYSREIPTLQNAIEEKGFTHAYVDRGSIITLLLELKLIDEITIPQAPMLRLSAGTLLGKLPTQVALENASAVAYPKDFVPYHSRVT